MSLWACKDETSPTAAQAVGDAAGKTVDAFTEYQRKGMASEAKMQLHGIATAVTFAATDLVPTAEGTTANGCLGSTPQGELGPTPPLTVNCAAGPKGNCTPGGTGPGAYDFALWKNDAVWSRLGVEPMGPHRYHYALAWKPGPNGGCTATARAFGDLDGDATWSTYEVAIEVSAAGEPKIGEVVAHDGLE